MSMTQIPREWGDQKHFTDEVLRLAAVNVPAYIIAELRSSFEHWKAENNWPEDAEPMWTIRWTYLEITEEQM